MSDVIDLQEREQALDISQSLIVQAPAGSGKTELLVQRFLKLLATVENPEQVHAITFTKKATQEMHERVVAALRSAQQPMPDEQHKQRTWQIAKKVLKKNTLHDWQLLNNPQRLAISTFDSLNRKLAEASPIASGYGVSPSIVMKPEKYYQQAVEELLSSIEQDTIWQDDLISVFSYFDNNKFQIEKLFVDMLNKRDQWLPYVVTNKNHNNLKLLLEKNIKRINEYHQYACFNSLTAAEKNTLISHVNFAAYMIETSEQEHPIAECHGIDDCQQLSVSQWQAVAELLLTKNNTYRKTVNKRSGFPAATSVSEKALKTELNDKKQGMLSLIASLAENEAFTQHLIAIRSCARPEYGDTQWRLLQALLQLLPRLVANLNYLFQTLNITDFIETAICANQALGTFDKPSPLLLQIDNNISHLLIDEFQDTSLSQYQLLEKLVSGWQQHEHKTLFLVGDPMQSIYGFRAAQVGLFVRAQSEGVGAIKLNAIRLCTNFRSKQTIVDWVNNSFSHMFPKDNDISNGAVKYSPSSAFNAQCDGMVSMHIADQMDPLSEAEIVLNILNQQTVDASIAILVRSRSHAMSLLALWQANDITVHAIDMLNLSSNMLIIDLVTITKTLLFPADRLAWLAFLRAPWCRFNLEELHIIANYDNNATLYDTLHNEQVVNLLSSSTTVRLQKALAIIDQFSHLDIASQVESVWLALNGIDYVHDKHDLELAQRYFEILHEYDQEFCIYDFEPFEQALYGQYFTKSQANDATISMMTIHKAKGLEFDTVIIPGIDRSPSTTNRQLLSWLEAPQLHGEPCFVLSPLQAPYDKETDSSIYRYVKTQVTNKRVHEDVRLFYVAATRAKNQLHFIYSKDPDEDDVNARKNSFYRYLNDSVKVNSKGD